MSIPTPTSPVHVRDTICKGGQENGQYGGIVAPPLPYSLTLVPLYNPAFQDQYKRQTILKTSMAFPCMLKRIPVVSKEEVQPTHIATTTIPPSGILIGFSYADYLDPHRNSEGPDQGPLRGTEEGTIFNQPQYKNPSNRPSGLCPSSYATVLLCTQSTTNPFVGRGECWPSGDLPCFPCPRQT